MAHAYHPMLDGYDEGQILHDGCSECVHRSKEVYRALAHMDGSTFERAWKRAYDWMAADGDRSSMGRISDAETPLLRALWQIQVEFERRGLLLNGYVPKFQDHTRQAPDDYELLGMDMPEEW